MLHDQVREGNRILAGESAEDLLDHVVQVRMMLDVLVAGLLEQRAEARAAKDFAAADAIRDRIKAAGIEIEDTPTGPQWSLGAGTP